MDDQGNVSGLLIDFDSSEEIGLELDAQAEDVNNGWLNIIEKQSNIITDADADEDEDEDEDIRAHERIWIVCCSFQVNQHS
jgi:hypothetical protein